MDSTPPLLTRSPTPSNYPYCPSDRSSLDYPSPLLLDQHYRIDSAYGPEDGCSMPATGMSSDHSITPTEWSSPTSLAPASTVSSCPVPSEVPEEYDAFATYGPGFSPSYPAAVYSHASSSQGPGPGAAAATSVTSSPASPDGVSRLPMPRAPRSHRSGFAPGLGASAPAPLAPRLKIKGHTRFSPGLEAAHGQYTPPRSLHSPYSAGAGTYSGLAHAFLNDSSGPPWAKPAYGPESGFYASPASDQQASACSADVPRAQQLRLNQHRARRSRRLTTKEEANFQCEIKGCGKLFSRSYNYKAHMETHDEKREYPFPCPVQSCSKRFVRKTDLQRHNQSVHEKQRNHKCEFCGRMFARKDTLRRHMEDGCSKRFDIGTLDIHSDAYGYGGLGSAPKHPSFAYASTPQATLPSLTSSSGVSPTLRPLPPRA